MFESLDGKSEYRGMHLNHRGLKIDPENPYYYQRLTRQSSSVKCVSAWYADGHRFDPHIRQLSLKEIGHEIISNPFSPFCWFKKASCQLLAKECALRTGKLPRRLAREQYRYVNWVNWPHQEWPEKCQRAVKHQHNNNQRLEKTNVISESKLKWL